MNLTRTEAEFWQADPSLLNSLLFGVIFQQCIDLMLKIVIFYTEVLMKHQYRMNYWFFSNEMGKYLI